MRDADVRVLGAELSVIDQAAAGRGFAGVVGVGEAVRIFTGAPVPEGADCILIQEDAEVMVTGASAAAFIPDPAATSARAARIFKTVSACLRPGRASTWRG